MKMQVLIIEVPEEGGGGDRLQITSAITARKGRKEAGT